MRNHSLQFHDQKYRDSKEASARVRRTRLHACAWRVLRARDAGSETGEQRGTLDVRACIRPANVIRFGASHIGKYGTIRL